MIWRHKMFADVPVHGEEGECSGGVRGRRQAIKTVNLRRGRSGCGQASSKELVKACDAVDAHKRHSRQEALLPRLQVVARQAIKGDKDTLKSRNGTEVVSLGRGTPYTRPQEARAQGYGDCRLPCAACKGESLFCSPGDLACPRSYMLRELHLLDEGGSHLFLSESV